MRLRGLLSLLFAGNKVVDADMRRSHDHSHSSVHRCFARSQCRRIGISEPLQRGACFCTRSILDNIAFHKSCLVYNNVRLCMYSTEYS